MLYVYLFHRFKLRFVNIFQSFFWVSGENHQNDESRPRCAKCERKTVSDFLNEIAGLDVCFVDVRMLYD